MKQKNIRQADSSPLWFRILLPFLSLCIICGIAYSILYNKGVLSGGNEVNPEKSKFNVLLTIVSEDPPDNDITAFISYDLAGQKIAIEAGVEDEKYSDCYHATLHANDLIHIIDKVGGITYTGDAAGSLLLSGQDAYRLALSYNRSPYLAYQAHIIFDFMESLRKYSDDAADMLRLLTYSYSRIETDISFKSASAAGKSILKADIIELEVLNEKTEPVHTN